MPHRQPQEGSVDVQTGRAEIVSGHGRRAHVGGRRCFDPQLNAMSGRRVSGLREAADRCRYYPFLRICRVIAGIKMLLTDWPQDRPGSNQRPGDSHDAQPGSATRARARRFAAGSRHTRSSAACRGCRDRPGMPRERRACPKAKGRPGQCAAAGAAARLPAVAGLSGRDCQARTGPPGGGQEKGAARRNLQAFQGIPRGRTKFVKGLEDHSATCGVPPDVIKQVKAGHSKATQTAKQVCDAAAQGPRPAGPSLSDALGHDADGAGRLVAQARSGDLRHADR